MQYPAVKLKVEKLKRNGQPLIAILFILFTFSCNTNNHPFDASGAFEAEETIISAEAAGTIKQFEVEEGEILEARQLVGYIDSTQLYLKKKQLQAQINAVLSKRPDIASQIASLQEQLKAAEKEQQRIGNLVKADAATPKQLDDVNAQIEVIKKQIEAQQSSLGVSSQGITQESIPLQIQIEQVNDQLEKSKITNPIKGTVLATYVEPNEIAVTGKALYKIADVSELLLKAYITGNQLSIVKLGQKVKVLVDDAENEYKEYEGTVTWISDKSEFTPKTIQTKDERANLVYAIKVSVKNDGYLKIGMYGGVKF